MIRYRDETARRLARFSWRLTAGLYVGALLFLLVALTLSPGAINAALGVGILAVVMTVASATVPNAH
jgi:hypothetical protein